AWRRDAGDPRCAGDQPVAGVLGADAGTPPTPGAGPIAVDPERRAQRAGRSAPASSRPPARNRRDAPRAERPARGGRSASAPTATAAPPVALGRPGRSA